MSSAEASASVAWLLLLERLARVRGAALAEATGTLVAEAESAEVGCTADSGPADRADDGGSGCMMSGVPCAIFCRLLSCDAGVMAALPVAGVLARDAATCAASLPAGVAGFFSAVLRRFCGVGQGEEPSRSRR